MRLKRQCKFERKRNEMKEKCIKKIKLEQMKKSNCG